MSLEQDIATLRAELTSVKRMLAVRVGEQATAATTRVVRQVAHGLAVKDVVRHNGTAWVKSQADAEANAAVGGMVIAVLSPDVFILATGGYVSGLSGLSAGSLYYLSAATAGAITTTKSYYRVPVLLADSASSGVLLSFDNVPQLPAGIEYPDVAYTRSTITTAASAITYTYNPTRDGTAYATIVGGGGGGQNNGSSSRVFVALSSGGAVTTTLDLNIGGGGGGSGAMVSLAFYVEEGSTVTIEVGAGGGVGAAGSSTLLKYNGNTIATAGGGSAGTADGGSGGNGWVGTNPTYLGNYPTCFYSFATRGSPANSRAGSTAPVANGGRVVELGGSAGAGGLGAQQSFGSTSGATAGANGGFAIFTP